MFLNLNSAAVYIINYSIIETLTGETILFRSVSDRMSPLEYGEAGVSKHILIAVYVEEYIIF